MGAGPFNLTPGRAGNQRYPAITAIPTLDRFIVGTACRFVPEKDLSLFLSVARTIHSLDASVCFVMAGDGVEHVLVRFAVPLGELGPDLRVPALHLVVGRLADVM